MKAGETVKKACIYCGKIHDRKIICGNKRKRLMKVRNTRADKFRSSAEWQHKRHEIKERDMYLCQVCIRSVGLDVNPYAKSNVSVHHIIALQQNFDKKLDNDNLITLCAYHHKQADDGKISVQTLQKIVAEQTPPEGTSFVC